MSYLLTTLGRGLLAHLLGVLETHLPRVEGDALEELRVRSAQSPSSADLATRLGTLCLQALRLGEAERCFQRASRLAPETVAPMLGLACVYDELGQFERAIRWLKRAQCRDPQDPAIAFAIGFCHERLGHTNRAVDFYQKSLRLCPRLRNGYERLAAIAVTRGEWNTAIDCYEMLADLEPDELDGLLTLANLYLQCDRPLEAIEQYQRALLIEPEWSEGAEVDIEELLEETDCYEAIQTAERLVEKYQGVAAFHLHLADLYVKVGDDAAAVGQFRAALALQPDCLEAAVKLGTQHMRRGRDWEAAETFNRAAELNDRLMLAFVGLGVAQAVAGREREAQATLDLAASLEPNSALLFSEAARLQIRSQRGSGARRGLKQPSFHDPHNDWVDEALRRYRQGLFSRPYHANLHYHYGVLLRQVGQFEAAGKTFETAVAIDPNYVAARVKLGICLREAGKRKEALDVFHQALGLSEDQVGMYYQLALLFAQRTQFDLVVEQFEESAATPQGSSSFRAALTCGLQNLGMVDRATTSWRSICELSCERDDAERHPVDIQDGAPRY